MMTILICATYTTAYSKLQDMLSTGEIRPFDAPSIVISRHGWLVRVRVR